MHISKNKNDRALKHAVANKTTNIYVWRYEIGNTL